MSRHLIIRCDAPDCAQQTETRAPDEAPASIAVPDGWFTLRHADQPDRHFCSQACVATAFAALAALAALAAPVVAPAPPVTRKRT